MLLPEVKGDISIWTTLLGLIENLEGVLGFLAECESVTATISKCPQYGTYYNDWYSPC